MIHSYHQGPSSDADLDKRHLIQPEGRRRYFLCPGCFCHYGTQRYGVVLLPTSNLSASVCIQEPILGLFISICQEGLAVVRARMGVSHPQLVRSSLPPPVSLRTC